jgi:predicted nucleotide-binding protein (sugar kinase/HSP70/actin superfamily)
MWPHKEGFSSGKTPKDTESLISSTNITLRDLLNIPTYRSSYEKMIQDLETWTNYNMLNLLAQAKIGTDANDTSFNSVQQFNALAEFKKNLDSFLDVVDKME